MVKITFSPLNQSFEVPAGTELLKAYAIHNEIPLKFGCTVGSCGVCIIEVAAGQQNLTKPTKEEKAKLKSCLDRGCRLACQCAILGDISITSVTNTDTQTKT
jgi:ferredoxin